MKNISTLKIFFTTLFVFCIISCDNYEDVKSKNTVEAYKNYLFQNPNSNRKQEILLKIQKLEFEKVVSGGNLSVMEDYLKNYPKSVWKDSVLNLVREKKFQLIKPHFEEAKEKIKNAKLYSLELKFEIFAKLSSYLAINAFNKEWANRAIGNSNKQSAEEISTLLIAINEFFLKSYFDLSHKKMSMKNTFDSLNVLFSFERENMDWKSLREKEIKISLEMFFCQSDTCFERSKEYLFSDEEKIKRILK